MELWLAIVLIAAAGLVGVVIGFLIRKSIAEKKIGSAEEQARGSSPCLTVKLRLLYTHCYCYVFMTQH